MTPHPLELSRLIGISVEEIESSRISTARRVAETLGVTLILKGAASVITDGVEVYINTTGSTALSKGGSGDVLAGLVTSLVANSTNPVHAAALGAYLHGLSGDALSCDLSDFGVIPSDLPCEIARTIKKIEQIKSND